MDRFDLTVRCIGKAIATAGVPFEFLCCDNGSKDRRVVDYIASLNPVYHRLNEINEGSAVMHNQMFLRCKGDYICLLDNDIEMPDAWLTNLLGYCEAIPETGIASIPWVMPLPPAVERNGKIVHTEAAFTCLGTRVFSRAVFEKVGYMHEGFGLYPYADADYQLRVQEAGYLSYYVSDMRCEHIGYDSLDMDYRHWKNEQVGLYGPAFWANAGKYSPTNFYIGPPALR